MDAKDRRRLNKQRKEAAKEAHKFHKEQEKRNKKSSAKSKTPKASDSKIKAAVNAGKTPKYENISREEKFLREGEEKIRNLQPQDFEDGYYIDEYSEKKRQEKRAKIIRKQENEVIRRNKKPMTAKQIRTRNILISAGIFAAVLVVGAILSLTVLFKTEKIDIEGDIYYEQDQIVAFSNVALQQNIFIAAWNSTPEEIVKNLTYVEDAQIGFAIPDTVTIKITNAVPTYVMKKGSEYLIISSKGRVLDTAFQNDDNLIELICGDTEGVQKGDYLKFEDDSVPQILDTVAKILVENGVDKVRGFDITNLSGIIINYDNRININIGLPEDIDYKIKTAFTIINEKLDPNKTGKIYGTLDVSTCNKNKVSHYKPAETIPTTEPPTEEATEPIDGTDYGWNTDTGTDWNSGAYYDPNAYTGEPVDDYYDSGYDYNDDDYSWDDNYDDSGYYDSGDSYYDPNAYSDNYYDPYADGYGDGTAW